MNSYFAKNSSWYDEDEGEFPEKPFIEGEVFADFIEICFREGNYFTLTLPDISRYNSQKNQNYFEFIDAFLPYKVNTIDRFDWFKEGGIVKFPYVTLQEFGLSEDSMSDFESSEWIAFYEKYEDYEFYAPHTINIYRCCSETKKLLLQYFDSFSINKIAGEGKCKSVNDLPHDLCFFKNNELILGSISHEDIVHIFPNSEEMEDGFLKYGNWEQDDFQVGEKVFISIDKDVDRIKTYSLNKAKFKETITNLEKMVNLCLENSAYVLIPRGLLSFWDFSHKNKMATENRFGKISVGELPQELDRYYIGYMGKMSWIKEAIYDMFGPSESWLYCIDIYKTNEIFEEYLMDYFRRVFIQEKLDCFNEFPRSVSFFDSEGYLLVGTSSTKGRYYAYARDVATQEIFSKLDFLDEVPYLAEEDFCINILEK